MMETKRITKLSKKQLVKIIEEYNAAAKSITDKFAIAFTGEVYGDTRDITDEDVRNLLRAQNNMSITVIKKETDDIIKKANER